MSTSLAVAEFAPATLIRTRRAPHGPLRYWVAILVALLASSCEPALAQTPMSSTPAGRGCVGPVTCAQVNMGSAVSTGILGTLSFMGQDSTGATVDYGEITGSVVTNRHGATLGALASSVPFGAPQINLGSVTPPGAPSVGATIYTDRSGVTHVVSANVDFPIAGAGYNGNHSIKWLIGEYGVGEPFATTSDYATYQIRKNVTGTGGFGSGSFGSALVVADSIPGFSAGTVALHAPVSSGASTIVTADNTSLLFRGQPLYAGGLAHGTTISSVAHNTPSSGLAKITLSTPTVARMFARTNGAGTVVSAGTSAATEAENTITATCDNWQSATPLNTCVAGFFSSSKHVAGGTAPFGLDVVSADYSGLSSLHGGASTVAAEMDGMASGPDNATYFGTGVPTNATGIRKALQLSLIGVGPSADGADQIADGAIVMMSSSIFANVPLMVNNGVRVLNTGGWGNFTNAFTADGSPTGETGLSLYPGFVSWLPSATSSSGASTITFGHITATVGSLISDASNCIPTNDTISSVSEGGSIANTVVTLAAPMTCGIATTDLVTLTNKFSDGWLATGLYTDAFANLTNTGAPGLIKFGSTLNAGTVGTLSFMGGDSSGTPVSYGAISASVVSDAAGATVGEVTINPSGGDTLVGALSAMEAGATSGFVHLPFTTTAPTGAPALTSGAACSINITSGNLNCYYGGAWHHAAFSPGAS